MASAWPTPADSTDIFRADMLEAISKALLERGALGFTLSGESGISDGTYLGWYIKHHTLRADPPDYNLDFRVFDTDNGMEGWDCQYAVEGFRDSKDDVPLPYDTYSQYTPYHFFNWRLAQLYLAALCPEYVRKGASMGTADMLNNFDYPRFFDAANGGLHFRRTTVHPDDPAFPGYAHGYVRTNRIRAMNYVTGNQNYAPASDNAAHLEVVCAPKILFDGDDQPYYGNHCGGVYETDSDTGGYRSEIPYMECHDHLTLGWVINDGTTIIPASSLYWARTGAGTGPGGTYLVQNATVNPGAADEYESANDATVVYWDEPGDVYVQAGTAEINVIGDYVEMHYYDPATSGAYLFNGEKIYHRLYYHGLNTMMIFYNDEAGDFDGLGWYISDDTNPATSTMWWKSASGNPTGTYAPGTTSAVGTAGSVIVGADPVAEEPAQYSCRSTAELSDASFAGSYSYAGRVSSTSGEADIPFYHKKERDSQAAGYATHRIFLDGTTWKIQKNTSSSGTPVWVTYWTKTGSLAYDTGRSTVQGIWTADVTNNNGCTDILVTRNRELSDILGDWVMNDIVDGINNLVWKSHSGGWAGQTSPPSSPLGVTQRFGQALNFTSAELAFEHADDFVSSDTGDYFPGTSSVMNYVAAGTPYWICALLAARAYAYGIASVPIGVTAEIDIWAYAYAPDAYTGYSSEFNAFGTGFGNRVWRLLETFTGVSDDDPLITAIRYGGITLPDTYNDPGVADSGTAFLGYIAAEPRLVIKFDKDGYDYY